MEELENNYKKIERIGKRARNKGVEKGLELERD